ncbi:MAG: Dihydroorotate oxidase [Candidatus Taylorbacteria bacterium]|nr:Dihydroorotate oxidase [Candidatus Taylorbacteria bacterium]
MFYKNIIRPLLFRLSRKDPETAHHLVITLLALMGKHRTSCQLVSTLWGTKPEKKLERTAMGLKFPHPVLLAAGFDKNALAIRMLAEIFGGVEIGTVTNEPQIGNPRPRMFRLSEDEALINRMGFNNDGATQVAERLAEILKGGQLKVPLGISFGKNKDTPANNIDAVIDNHLEGFRKLARFANYAVLNCASPNTPDLRTLLERGPLGSLIEEVQKTKRSLGLASLPLVVKLSPDMDWDQIEAALEVCNQFGVAGIIAANTSLGRESLKSSTRSEIGGLSGAPIYHRALELVRHVRKELPNICVIGSGGINSPERATRMLDFGADLIQIYTGFVYEGPSFVRSITQAI